MNIPTFQPNGLLPPGDYEVSFDELRRSVLVSAPPDTPQTNSWDSGWRHRLVDNLEILTKQLWQVGVREVYADGSFAEDKDHPNDIDGYFVCGLKELASGDLTQRLNLLTHSRCGHGILRRESPIAAIRRNNSRCGTGIGWNSIRIFQV